jgi:hypothetical protein
MTWNAQIQSKCEYFSEISVLAYIYNIIVANTWYSSIEDRLDGSRFLYHEAHYESLFRINNKFLDVFYEDVGS